MNDLEKACSGEMGFCVTESSGVRSSRGERSRNERVRVERDRVKHITSQKTKIAKIK